METESRNSKFWGTIGKLGVLVALVYGVIEIVTFFTKSDDYEAKAHGEHSFYETAPPFQHQVDRLIEYRALLRTPRYATDNIKVADIDSMIESAKKDVANPFNLFSSSINVARYDVQPPNFNSLWSFSIENTGNKPIEGLVLEVPFDGYFKVSRPGDSTRSGMFEKRIEIGDLRPSYEAKIICWGKDDSYFSSIDEEKTRFTHKNGWFTVQYPTIATGFYAWLVKHDLSLSLFLSIFLTLFAMFGVFMIVGSVLQKSSKPQALDESAQANASEPSNDSEASEKITMPESKL